jgi:hypothetical protein
MKLTNMRELVSLAIVIPVLVYLLVTFKTEPKHSKNNPYIYWNDRTNPPHRGFELKVDMYYNQTKDTIYMEYSSGPEGE